MDKHLVPEMQSELTIEILSTLDTFIRDDLDALTTMLKYPLGLESGSTGEGKRIRPVILLLVCDTLGGNWRKALPGAAAIELIHNFSLVHDDIQDKSEMRRGKASVWKKFGTAQAINAGDLLFILANGACMSLQRHFPAQTVVQANQVLLDTSIQLIQGQYLDLSFESTEMIDLDDYWKMVDGKTGALFSAAFGLGALLAGKEPDAYLQLGFAFGRAFQVQDDWLGIWGETRLTGKSNLSDLLEKKKSFPVVNALRHSVKFRETWQKAEIVSEGHAKELLSILDDQGCNQSTHQAFDQAYQIALQKYSELFPDQEKSLQLRDYLTSLFNRAT